MVKLKSKAKVKDKFGRSLRDLRISVTDQCFLRCFYCMPKEIFGRSYCFADKSDLLSYDHIVSLVRSFAEIGVEKIRLTGGEPLLRPGLSELISRIKEVDGIQDIALTTNGLLLEKYLSELKDSGLHRLNISMDAIDDDVLQKVTGKNINGIQILNAITASQDAGFPVKVNMVVTRGVNDEQILPMARYMKEQGVVLRFIEYMDVGNINAWKKEQVVSGSEIREMLSGEFNIETVEPEYSGEVARRYRYADCGTELGFIESVSKPFCGDCNRARISATGNLFTCLFSNSGFDLKPWLSESPDQATLTEKLSRLWLGRHDRYSEERFTKKEEGSKVEMWQIGG